MNHLSLASRAESVLFQSPIQKGDHSTPGALYDDKDTWSMLLYLNPLKFFSLTSVNL